uniref:ATP synthase subunit a n=1 Tax=Microcosmus sulcatus TaxID=341086 RepID=D2YVG8_9ASCI|nr:ATP synthase F0 subunit 6 [Microcosmus sulcatus]CAL23091.2 ATPase subunit 6 [Microcosmus sulcatus]
MFSVFESAWVVGVFPIGILMLIVFYWLYSPIGGLGSNVKEGNLFMLMSHFGGLMYPGFIFILGLFFMILVMNIIGLVPGGFPVSSMPGLTLMVALVMWGGGFIYCLVNNLSGVVSHFLPVGSPMVLSVVLVWIEVISWLCRPLALGVRLMANITAGHLLLHLFGSGVFFMSGVVLFLPLVMLFMLFLLEVAVAVIQAYVYSLLLTLYMDEGLG